MAKPQEYTIKMKDGTEKKVSGLVINNRWGIDKRQYEVAKTNKNGESKTTLSSFFCLTHIPTGILVTNANTQKALKELVNRPDMIEEDDLKKIAKATVDFWNERWWNG